MTPSASNSSTGKDASGNPAEEKNEITFQEMDAIYFANIACGEPMNMSNVLPDGVPTYPNGSTTWLSTDFSLQLSISLVQWGEWQENQQQAHEAREFESTLPGR